MDRSAKIEALAEEYEWDHAEELGDKSSFIAGALAGIALRDAELLEKLGTFDEQKVMQEFGFRFISNLTPPQYIEVLRWQHEQFMKILKK